MTIWRQVFEPDLTSTLSLSEIDAFRKSSAETDPIASQIHDTVAYVRGIIRSSPAKVALDPDELTLPESLIRPAMDYLRFNVLTRCNLVVNESRTKTYEKACEILEMIRKGEFVPESAANATADVAGVAGSPTFATATPSRLLDAILFIVALGCTFSASAIDLKWTCNAPETRAESFTAYHGETVTFSPTFKAYGLPASVTANMVFYQTNGMADAWWHTDGLVFAPSNDVGASSYRFFVAASDSTGTVYRANGILRMLPSPGFEPNVLQTPPLTIDFSKVQTLNAPWNGKLDQPAADARYLQLGGGTMTGSLWIPASRLHIGDALDYSFYGPGYITRVSAAGETIHYFRNDGMAHTVAVTDDIPTDEHITDLADAAASTKADASTVEALSVAVNEANAWAQGTFNFLSGNTNAWFAGTNYVTGADITNKMHFTIEEGMDLLTMPCSMALLEIRDGQRGCVWDQRDWTAWYWKFKSQQMMAQVAASNAVIHAEIASDANHAWAKHYASSGRVNPDSSTTYIDTKRVCLSPGMAWETVAEVNGAAYWTIVGNGAVFGGSGTNAILEIKDFEGNAIMTITKGEHQLVGLLQESFTNDGPRYDADGWACFEILANVQPVGYFSVTPYAEDFVAETSSDCPALFRWEQITAPSQGVAGKWRIHFLLKPEIIANACFAKFLVEVQGQTQVKYTAGMNIEGGLIYGGKKIVPVIPVGAQAGDTITWKVAQ